MNYMEAVREAGRLYAMWVSGDGKVDLDRTHASILQDLRWRRDKPQFAGVVREMRGHLVLLGKIRKAYQREMEWMQGEDRRAGREVCRRAQTRALHRCITGVDK